MRRPLVLVLIALVACRPGARATSVVRPHVYLVIVDGLDPRRATAEDMPALFRVLAEERARSSFFAAAHAVMPARTNPNHVTLLTGVYADAHGITGNTWWSRARGTPPAKLEDPTLIEVETLFTVIETTMPSLVTLGAFAKPKLARLFGDVPGRQRAPDVLWTPADGYASDEATMNALLAAAAASEPDLAVVNIADVDRAGHVHGPDGADYARAVAGADRALGRLVDDLRARGRWGRSIVVVTADHGMSDVKPPPVSLADPLARSGIDGIVLAADGGIEHVYADSFDPNGALGRPVEDRLAAAASLASVTPGVVEVLARVPVHGVPRLSDVHPDWHLDHPRAGDLLLVAAHSREFVDPFDPADATLRGNHGSPAERTVPLAITGGWDGLRAAPAGAAAPGLVDVAPTIERALGLRRPRRVDGSAVPPERAGRPIAQIVPHSPH
jgi:type I phosphodiesterase/nucleotide pyrophosphatase